MLEVSKGDRESDLALHHSGTRSVGGGRDDQTHQGFGTRVIAFMRDHCWLCATGWGVIGGLLAGFFW